MFAVLHGVLPAHAVDITDVQIVHPAQSASVQRYERLELFVTLSGVSATDPYSPAPSSSGLDMSATFVGPSGTIPVNGFYDGVDWRVRFSPAETGAWTFTVGVTDPGGSDTWAGGTFTCVSSSFPGFAHIDGRRLRSTNGDHAYAIGHNNGWQYDLEQPSFASMSARGESLLSFWQAVPWASPSEAGPGTEWKTFRAAIENLDGGIGNYHQPACAYIDGLVERAEAAGVCLLPCIWSHGELRDAGHPWGAGWWANNAYSTICSAADFFKTDDGGATPQWIRQQNLFRYILSRWGHSRAILGWIVVVEMEGTTGYRSDQSQALDWCAAVNAYFAANDAYRSSGGKASLATTFTDEATADAASKETGHDLRSIDAYIDKSDAVNIAGSIAGETETMLLSGKPSFHNEFGANDAALQPQHLHNGIWAGLSAGAALSPMLWCDGGSWPMLTDPTVGEPMRGQLEALDAFVRQISCLGDAGLAGLAIDLDTAECRGWGQRVSDRGFAWIQDRVGALGGEQATLSELDAGLYLADWFDVWVDGDNAFLTQDGLAVDAGGELRLAVPTTTRHDLAVSFERIAASNYVIVVVSPPEAVAAGASWRLTGGPGPDTVWLDSGAAAADVPPGSYTMEFAAVNGWQAPPDQAVGVLSGSGVRRTGVYVISGTHYDLIVASRYDAGTPPVGTHNYASGTELMCSVTGSPVTVSDAYGMGRHVCTGWVGAGSVPASGIDTNLTFTITEKSQVTWQWAVQDLVLSNQVVSGTVSTQALETIQAGRGYVVAPGADVSLEAGGHIRLTDGFNAASGSVFRATIDGP